MSSGPFLNIKAPKALLERLDDYRYATLKPSRAEAARELLDQALKAFSERYDKVEGQEEIYRIWVGRDWRVL